MKTLWPDAYSLDGITDHQANRCALATARPVGVLGGNPGAGKTYLSAKIIKACADRFGPHTVAVCAPTGKAAVRITEAMLGHGLDKMEASTIHRLLGVTRNGHDQKGWGFAHNQANPLRKRFVFIDESSMADVSTCASLVAACSPGTHVLWIGDFGQLPPVGHGAPLRDMIAAGLPYGELTEIHRNEGDIVRACRDVKEGRSFRPSRIIDIDRGHNLKHIEASRPSLALGALGNILRNPPPGIDPVWDVQILCALNEKSEVGRKNLNRMIQGILNPAGEQVEGNRFRMGDKVICLTNGMLPMVQCTNVGGCDEPMADIGFEKGVYFCGSCGKSWKPNEAMQDFVANGEIGKVSRLAKDWMHVWFDSPRRTIRVSGEWLREFDLAYAVTTHKSQGSQWPIVICMADESGGANMVCSWEFWRTAWSRAEKLCVTIGRKATIDRHCQRSALAGRKTFLREQLLAGMAA